MSATVSAGTGASGGNAGGAYSGAPAPPATVLYAYRPQGFQLPARFVGEASQYPVGITAVHYSLLSAEDTHRMSQLSCRRVINTAQQDYGVNDAHLGVCDRNAVCATCGLKSIDCVGHIGHIDLEAPVFHVGLFHITLRILRTICKHCARVLLTQEEKEVYRRKLRRDPTGLLAIEPQQHQAIVKQIQEDAYKTRVCPYCGALNGVVRRVRPMRLIHERHKVGLRRGEERNAEVDRSVLKDMKSALAHNSELREQLEHVYDILDPVRVRNLFLAVPKEDYHLLGMPGGAEPGITSFEGILSPSSGRAVGGGHTLRGNHGNLLDRAASPVDLLLSTLVVPPVCVRPRGVTTTAGGPQVREDDLTILLNEIIVISDAMKDGTNDTAKYVEHWETLQARVVRLLDSAMPGYPLHQRTADVKAFAQRLKGKHGRFRGNLSGKRVDFSGRSVISPDPNLDIDELAVPIHVARVLTYPQRVFAHNVDQLRRLVRNGPNIHPGAVTVFLAKENSRRSLAYARDREVLAARLSVGDIVERHVLNGDVMLFNRQPSLHRISMMAHRARVLPFRTFRFNECCCAPYNADFDGDEMNVHLVQTEEARAEAEQLMLAANHIVTAKNGEPILSATQDFLTAAYLVTSRDAFFDRSQFTQMVSHFLGASTVYELPIPALLKPAELWTGKQLIEVIVRPSPDSGALLTLEAKARFFSNRSCYGGRHARAKVKHDDEAEGFVAFLDSHYLSGRLDKKLLGGGAKDGLFARLYALSGGRYTARVMTRIAQFTSRYLQNYGFSLGLGDVSPTPSLNQKKNVVLTASFAKCEALIREAKAGRLAPLPGMSVRQTLEAKLNGELSKVRDECGTAAVETLDPRFNAPLIMVQSGSKGSALNTAQMMACVGQQTVNGRRITNAFQSRSLPHFCRFAETPAARGFVANSFYSGLTPVEFFFHTMAGREGLVDTAVKTAETGYIYRRLSKAMENLCVQYDGSVRVAHPLHGSTVVQLRYGDDGMDPWLMEGNDGTPLNLQQEWLSAKAGYARFLQAREKRELALARAAAEAIRAAGGHASQPQAAAAATSTVVAQALARAESTSLRSTFAQWHVLSLLPEEVGPFVESLLSGEKDALSRCQQQRNAEQREAMASAEVERTLKEQRRAAAEAEETAGKQAQAAASPSSSVAAAAVTGGGGAGEDELMAAAKSHLTGVSGGASSASAKGARRGVSPSELELLPSRGVDTAVARFAKTCSVKFYGEVVAFFEDLVKQQRGLRTLLGLPLDGRLREGREEEEEEVVEVGDFMESLQTDLLPLTKGMISYFLTECARLYIRKACEPGTPCGAIAAQSVGEPSTQMTLRTFHFAGVASMSITQGVPRLVEIINANKKIATPVVTAPVVVDEPRFSGSLLPISPSADPKLCTPQQRRLATSRAVKALMERVTLKEVCTELVEVVTQQSYYIQVFLNMELIERLLLPIDAHIVCLRLLEVAAKPMSALRSLREDCLSVVGRDSLIVRPYETNPKGVHFNAQFLLSVLPDLVVSGVPGINRVMITKGGQVLQAEGAELRSVMVLPHVDGTRTTCNHVAVVERTLGIEAARQVIVSEINGILKAYSLSIDTRHVYLLADVMTSRGSVLGITRYGIQKMSNSVLTMASFERTTEHLYNAAAQQRSDTKLSVSESIIVGRPIPLGTASFTVLLDHGEEGSSCGGRVAATKEREPSAGKRTAAATAATSLQEAFLAQAYRRCSLAANGSGSRLGIRSMSGGSASLLGLSSSPPLFAEGAFHIDVL